MAVLCLLAYQASKEGKDYTEVYRGCKALSERSFSNAQAGFEALCEGFLAWERGMSFNMADYARIRALTLITVQPQRLQSVNFLGYGRDVCVEIRPNPTNKQLPPMH